MKYEKHPSKIISKLESSRLSFLNFLNHIDEGLWFEKKIDKWSVNEIIIHIIGWDKLLLSDAKVWVMGEDPNREFEDEDELNKQFLEMYKFESKDDAIRAFNNSTNEIITFLRKLNKKQIDYAVVNESLVDLDMYKHDMEHLKELKKHF